MTAAFNLSQLANNLNTSGQLDATDGLVGSVPVANGGTGRSSLTGANVLLGNGTGAVNFVAPGAAGNALVSNGSTWTSAGIDKLSTASGSAPSFSARAWGQFIGTATPSVTGGNISSAVYGGVAGVWTINFTTSMPDANYAVTTTQFYPAGNNPSGNAVQINTIGSGSFVIVYIQYVNTGPIFYNGFPIMFAVFR
jgi:hypothetical protein